MDIQVLISTTSSDPSKFTSLNFNKLVVSQNKEGVDLDEPGYRFLSYDEKGLSKSRNRCLQSAEGDLVMVADDDLIYCDDFESKVIEAFRDRPDADGITFRVVTPEGNPYKGYSQKPFRHNRKSIFNVSSVEMVFRLESIRKNGLNFDEKFGLGAKFKSGEETIFLNDALNRGMKIYFVPEDIVIHPLESSGKVLDENFFYSKGALIKRMYSGTIFMVLGILFLLKQIMKNQNQLTLAASIQSIKKGFRAL